MKGGPITARTEEERLLAAQTLDRAERAQRTGCVTASKFLTPAEAAFVAQLARTEGLTVVFDGGRPNTERQVALFPPDWLDADAPESWIAEESPVTVLRFRTAGGEELGHRDYLGALMAAGIRRDAVGDIDVHGAEAYFFCLTDMAPYLMQNVTRAGRARLTCEEVPRDAVPPPEAEDAEELHATVGSLRLDAVAAAAFRISREDAKSAILQGLCTVNHLPAEKPDADVEEGDLLALRGKGRARLSAVRGETRKGRVAITVLRYR